MPEEHASEARVAATEHAVVLQWLWLPFLPFATRSEDA